MHFPKIQSAASLRGLINEIGFLPLFDGSISGFSVSAMTDAEDWWTGDQKKDPWQWRMQIAAEGEIAYGKLIEKKSAFVSKKWYPVLANFRREGYDFDARYEDGKAKYKEKRIMDHLLETGITLPSYELKRLAGFGGKGERGFEGALTALQMRTYITVRGMERKRSKSGDEYGWPVSLYSTPEELFGEKLVRSAYSEEPNRSEEKLSRHISSITGKTMEEAHRFIR